jgi:hypothetical protein
MFAQRLLVAPMRFSLCASAVALAGCGHSVIVPAEKVSTYASGRTVVTVDGTPVNPADGGTVEVLPREGSCLSTATAGYNAAGTRFENLVESEALICARHRVSDVRTMDPGTTLRIAGNEELYVRASAVGGLQIHDPYWGPAPYAPNRAMRSPAMLGLGIAATVVGTAGAITAFSWLVAASADDEKPSAASFGWEFDLTPLGVLVGGLSGVALTAGGGVMIHRGRAETRVPGPLPNAY